MKKIFIFAAIAALFAACSSKDELVTDDNTQQPQLEKGTVGFDVYIQKATTRAGWAGSLTTTELQNTDPEPYKVANGFGVFGYYTDNNEYEQRSVPNFMYNQQVTWNGSTAWEYTPIVYWPNEYGSNATSDDQDKLTFFAYAPYVKVIPTSGKVARTTAASDPDDTKYQESYGITGMTKNTTQGDPILKYIASFDNKKSVDLCWGVADKGDGAAWNIVQTGNPQTEIKDGLPWIDLERPAGVDQRVRFTFKHATAQMRVSIDADIDVDGRGETNPLTKKTRIWVREVKFKGFTMKGSLNLNNEDPSIPKWLDYNGQNELVAEDVIVYDGRKDGKEGVAGAVATNEKTLGLNPALIQDGVYEKGEGDGVYDNRYDVAVYGVDATGATKKEADWARPGVTNTAVNLFRYDNAENKSQKAKINAGSEFFHVIPVNDNFEVEIVYDVETVDDNLAQNLSDGATKGSTIENRISKTITFGSENQLKAGHSYTLALHLGMNSVKFDAAVTEWIDEAAQDVDLPLNTSVFAAAASGASVGIESNPHSITIPYMGHYSFAITGMHGQENVAGTPGKKTTSEDQNAEVETDGTLASWSAADVHAWTNGTALLELITAPNPTTTDRIQKWSWKGSQSNIETYFAFTQKAHPLFMKITKMTNNSTNGLITLTRYNDANYDASDHWTNKNGWICDGTGKALTPSDISSENYIKVERNGAPLTWSTTATGENFKFTNRNYSAGNSVNSITIGEKLQKGDVIKVTIKTGDAPEETVTAVYEGMYFSSASATIEYGQTGYTLPEVKNAYGSVTYTSKNTDIATVSGSTITTGKPGTVIIEAKDEAGSKAEFTLTVDKQETEITVTSGDHQAYGTKTAGTEIFNIAAITTFKGKYDSSITGGSLTYSIYSAKVGSSDVSSAFTVTSDGKLKLASNLSGSNYTIIVTVNGALTDEAATKYNLPAEQKVTITFP